MRCRASATTFPTCWTADAVREVAAEVNAASGCAVRSVNGDIGDLNRPLDAQQRAERDEHLDRLLEPGRRRSARRPWCCPTARSDHDPIADLDADLDRVAAELIRAAAGAPSRPAWQLWVESLHLLPALLRTSTGRSC